MPNDLIFIRDVIYHLKREYGEPLIIGKIIDDTLDPKTGKTSYQTSEIKIARAIRLPNRIAFDLLRSMGYMKGGENLIGTIELLIDKKDLPVAFGSIEPTDFAIFDHKRQDIVKVNDFPYAYVLVVKEIQQAPQVGLRTKLTDQLTISGTVVDVP